MVVWIALSACREAIEVRPPVAPVVQTLDVHLETSPGIRDLVAVAPDATRFIWRVNDVPTDLDTNTVPAHRQFEGDTWHVVAEDGEGLMGQAEHTVPAPPGGNVLVLLLDDVGVDKVSSYGKPQSPDTPVLDGLAAEGVRFTRAYTSMACSPTRGLLLTGRHASRTGLGWLIDSGISRTFSLPLEAITIPEALNGSHAAQAWSHSALGKWHVAGPNAEGYLSHPNDQGFDWYAGRMLNPWYRSGTGYYRWEKNTNGVVSESTTYMTTDLVDDAIDRMAAMPEPWFLYVAFNAVHTPLQAPPAELVETEPPADAPDWVLYDAMLEATETEIARMLDSMDPETRARTTIIVAGDNGTHNYGNAPEFDDGRNKGTPYEGGVRVPLIVTGPHVSNPGSTRDALVHLVDILPTVADIAGVPLGGSEGEWIDLGQEEKRLLDGRSLLPVLGDAGIEGRAYLWAEGFYPNGDALERSIDRRTLFDHTWKLVRQDGSEEFYRIDPETELDTVDLLGAPLDAEAEEAFARLSLEMDLVADTVIHEGF